MDFSRLRPFIGDDKEDGPDTMLVLKGFSGRDEIETFMGALMTEGILKPKKELKQ